MSLKTLSRYCTVANALCDGGHDVGIRLHPWSICVRDGTRWRHLTIRRAKDLAARTAPTPINPPTEGTTHDKPR